MRLDMAYITGIAFTVLISALSLYTLYSAARHYRTLRDKSRKCALLIRELMNMSVMLTIIAMIVMSMLGVSYLYGFLVFVAVLLVGGVVSFIFDVLL